MSLSPVSMKAISLSASDVSICQLGIGLNIDDHHLSNLRFADDILLLATNKDDVIAMLEILILELEDIGLILNPNKTKILTTISANGRDAAANYLGDSKKWMA